MAANNRDLSAAGFQLISTVALGANGGATDVFTWTHNRGARAVMIQVVDSTNKVPVLDATVAVTQPTTNQIVLDNAGGALDVDVLILWAIPSEDNIRPITGAALITAGEAVAS